MLMQAVSVCAVLLLGSSGGQLQAVRLCEWWPSFCWLISSKLSSLKASVTAGLGLLSECMWRDLVKWHKWVIISHWPHAVVCLGSLSPLLAPCLCVDSTGGAERVHLAGRWDETLADETVLADARMFRGRNRLLITQANCFCSSSNRRFWVMRSCSSCLRVLGAEANTENKQIMSIRVCRIRTREAGGWVKNRRKEEGKKKTTTWQGWSVEWYWNTVELLRRRVEEKHSLKLSKEQKQVRTWQEKKENGGRKNNTSGVKGDYPYWVLNDPSLTFTERPLIQITPGGFKSKLCGYENAKASLVNFTQNFR